jgi:anthranilate phosphoribosyltransferase
LSLEKYSAQKFENIFDQIFENKINSESIKDFLLELNAQNLPINSFFGAINSLKKRMIKIPNHQDALDVCGTGGDKLKTLNISTAVAIILACAGVKIAKHGNRAVSSASGSADIFTHLGIAFDNNLKNIDNNLHQNNLCFLFAPFFHPDLKNVAEIRKSINEPTIFNYIGPLLNPTNPQKQIIGTSRKDVMYKIAEVLLKINPAGSFYIVHGFDGMDEITISDDSYLLKISHQKINEMEIIDPENYGINKCKIDEIIGGDPEYNSQKMLELFAGKTSKYLDIVVLNCAFALQLIDKIPNINDGIIFSQKLLESGKVSKFLTEIKNNFIL